MPRAILAAANVPSLAIGTTYYLVLGNANFNSSSTNETYASFATHVSGLVTSLSANIRANSLSTASTTFRFRKNGANGNLTVSAAAAATGVFTDTSTSDSLSPGDTFLVSAAIDAGGTGNLNLVSSYVNFAATAGHVMFINGMAPTSFSTSTASTAFYQLLANGSTAAGTAEADTQIKIPVAGSVTNFQTYISANGRSTSTTWVTRINGADGNCTFSVGAGSTGLFSDTSNTDTISSGDLLNFKFTTGTGGSAIAFRSFGLAFSSTANKNPFYTSLTAGINRTAGAGNTYYNPFGTLNTTTTTAESSKTFIPGFPTTLSNIMISVLANTCTASVTFKSRKNSADGNQSVSIATTATGLFEDTTNTDVLDYDDDFTYGLVGGTSGTLTFNWMGGLQAPAIPSRSFAMIA